jgi:N6-adenosine-specific RNA methylase IME4
MYSVIYADPPWDYEGRIQHDGTNTGSAINHYPTLKIEKIKEMNVPALCEKNALLFLWTSSPHLDQSLELMKAWGFTYKTIAFVWDKQRIIPGYYTLSQVEICLVGKRGKIPTPRGTRNEKQFLTELRGEHSAKPTEIRERIARMFPTQKKLEMFARQKTPGWDVFGNQVEDSIAIPPRPLPAQADLDFIV